MIPNGDWGPVGDGAGLGRGTVLRGRRVLVGQGVGCVSTKVGDWADGSAERFPPEMPVEHAQRNPTAIQRVSSARDLTRMPIISVPSSDSTLDLARSYSPDACEWPND